MAHTALTNLCLQIASWTKLSVPTVNASLDFIQAPDDCVGIETVAFRLRKLMRYAAKYKVAIEWAPELQVIANALCAEVQTVRELAPKRPVVGERGDMYGLCSKNPVWAMIALTDCSHRYGLQMFSFASTVLQITPALTSRFPDHLIQCTRAVRILSEQGFEKLAHLKPLDVDLRKAYAQLKGEQDPQIESVRLALAIALEVHIPKDGTGRATGGSGGYQQIRGSVDARADDVTKLHGSDDVDGARHYSYRAPLKTKFSGEVPAADDPCDDSPAPSVLISPPIDEDEGPLETSAPEYVFAARSLCMPAANDVLTPHTCGKVAAEIVATLESGSALDAAKAFLLGLQLFHGVSSRSISEHTFVEGALVVPVAMTFHRPPPPDWAPFLRETDRVFHTPLCRPLAKWIEKPDHAALVQTLLSSENLIELLRGFLARLMSNCELVATVGRLANTFRNSMYSFGADYADVVLAVGSPDRDLCWSVTYTARETEALQRYIDSTHRRFEVYAREHRPEICLLPSDVRPARSHVGSLRTPEPYIMQRLAREMYQLVDSSRDDLIRFHNLYVTYTGMVVAAATASRTSAARLSRTTDFSQDFWWVFVSDKDNSDYRGARVLLLPPDARLQVMRFLDHLERIERITGLSKLSDVAKVHMFRRGDSVSEIRGVEFEQRHRQPGLFYLLDDGGRPYIPTMARIAEFVPEGLFPPSFYPIRHYLRTEGRKQGVPPEVLHYGFGHWPSALSPFSKFSLTRPSELATSFAEFTDSIMQRDGWRPLDGWK